MTNVLMISLDDLNDWTGSFGGYAGTVYTPNLDRLAGEGVSFANAFASVPVCNPSRSAVLTGWSPLTTGVFNNTQKMFDLVDAGDTLPAILRDAGYTTATAGKVFHVLPDAEAARAYDRVLLPQPDNAGDTDPADVIDDNKSFFGGIYVGDADGLGDLRVATAVEAFLAGYAPEPDAAGLFLSVGLSRPHLPWVAPREFFDLYPLDSIQVPERIPEDLADLPQFAQLFAREGDVARVVEAGEIREYIQAYLASISFADALLGRLLDALEASVIAGDTTVVLWSDHGYHLGEKETFGKFTLWEEATRAPLIIRDPNAADRAGTVSDQVVSLLDIFPTVLDYAGVATPPRDGQSLRDHIATGDTTGLDNAAVTMIAGSYSLRTATHRYTRYADGSEELYDLAADPTEFTNLALEPDAARVKARLAAALDAQLDEHPFQGGTPGRPQRLAAALGERVLIAGDAGDTLLGGAADNLYLVNAPGVTIIEAGKGGIDEVLTTGSFTLPAHVENLTYSFLAEDGDPGAALQGNALDNDIAAKSGNNRIDGGAGDDSLSGGSRADTIGGGSGADVLKGGDGDDVLDGGVGDDRLRGADRDDTYVLSAGEDRIEERNGSGQDRIDAAVWGLDATRLDWLYNANGILTELLLTRDGTDDVTHVIAEQGALRVELLVDGARQRLLVAGKATGTGADDTIEGTDGDDRLIGADGNDLLAGGLGRDTLEGGAGRDTLEATAGDAIDGGAGRDVASWANALDGVTVSLTPEGRVRNVERLVGSSFDDRFNGDAADNAIDGAAGRDCIEGGGGSDLLTGGAGQDTLAGGSGFDRFAFLSLGDSSAVRVTADRILDFDPSRDKLVLAAIDARPDTAADDAFVVVTGGFDAAGQLRIDYGDSSTYVALNIDTDAAPEMTIRLDGLLALTTANLVL